MQVALVTNTLAGSGKAIQLSQKLKAILNQRGINSIIIKEDEWSPTIYEFDQVWIVGGDGTINYFVNQFNDIKKPLVIFSGGTGNDFYSLLYGKISPEDQVNYVLQATPKPIDAGKCNDRYFLNGVGLGFEGAVAKSLTGTKKFGGKTSFLIHILKHIFSYKEFIYSIKTDVQEIEQKCLMISIANGKRYAGGFYVAPLADPQDGLLDAIIVQQLSIFQRLRYLPVIEKGKHLSLPLIKYFKTNRIIISSTNNIVQAHLDGEYYESQELTIEVLPAHFNFIY